MLTEAIRAYIQRNFDERILMASGLAIVLTPYTEIVRHKRMQKSIPPEIPSSLMYDIYRVFYFKKTFVVDLNRHTCSCRKWHIPGITCSHVIAT
uniref:SWIM-type domain-containing protein n=1 Tax=Lactuca sativa TaxID=4236 RepID=A0A9R1UPV9_LACSA|nr:hypothetical protein LSAT_V11C800402960 [Lactuca sativa]